MDYGVRSSVLSEFVSAAGFAKAFDSSTAFGPCCLRFAYARRSGTGSKDVSSSFA